MNEVKQSKSVPVSKRQVWEAYKRVRANKGSAGVDGISFEEFDQNLSGNLYKLWNRLASGSYFPPAVKQVSIPKKDGSVRKLGIPTISDRIAQQVIKEHLEPGLESIFHPSSYGYRPKKSAHAALEQAIENSRSKDWVIDLDIKGFFDNLDHEILLEMISLVVKEKWVMMYLKRWLKAETETAEGRIKREKGTPQGGVISPLLANVYLHFAFDNWMQRKLGWVKFERYADDIVVHCQTEKQAKYILHQIRQRLKRAQLELHPEKTKIVYCKDDRRKEQHKQISFDFLGYTFRMRKSMNKLGEYYMRFTPAISVESGKRITQEIRSLKLQRCTSQNILSLALKVNSKLRGWINYFGRYGKEKLLRVLNGLNMRLYRWAAKRHKKFKGGLRKARVWMQKIFERDPHLFAHWSFGNKP